MIILLPGMDGTGALFARFRKTLPTACSVRVVQYPPDLPLTYPELEQLVLKHLPTSEPIVLVAESFSGPIALRLSAMPNLNIQAAILVCSFSARPLGWFGTVLALMPIRFILGFRLPATLLRLVLLGNSAPDAIVSETANAISSVQPHVLAKRLKEALTSRYCRQLVSSDVRVVALYAKRDRLLGKTALRSILSIYPKAETYRIDAPHLALQMAPAEVTQCLSDLGVLGGEECKLRNQTNII